MAKPKKEVNKLFEAAKEMFGVKTTPVKKKELPESYVRDTHETSKPKPNKVAFHVVQDFLLLGMGEGKRRIQRKKAGLEDPPSLEQATKDGKPTKYEATGDDLRRANEFEAIAKKMGVHTKEGAVAHNRSTLIQSTNRSPWSWDKGKGDLNNLIDASNLPTKEQMDIAKKMKKEITKPKKKKRK